MFHAQEKLGAELRAVRKAAAAADRDVAALTKAVHDLEKQTLLFGDLQHYLSVIEGEIAGVAEALGRVQEAQQDAAQRVERQQREQQQQHAGQGSRPGSAAARRLATS